MTPLEAAALALPLGLVAGITPGPLLALVVSESLRHGASAGVRAATAPLATDAPLLVVVLAGARWLSGSPWLIGIVSLAGSAVVLWLACDAWSAARHPPSVATGAAPASGRRAMLVNVLNPHAWLFWLTVGAPLIARTLSVGVASAAAFIGTFYAALVGSKVMVALAAARSAHWLCGVGWFWLLRALALVLAAFSLELVFTGARLAGA